jgi:hypothetical protein
MKGAALHRCDAFSHQLLTAVHEARLLRAVLQRALGNFVVIGLVRLPEVCSIRIRDRPLLPHPMQCGACIESAGKCDPDFFTNRNALKNIRHKAVIIKCALIWKVLELTTAVTLRDPARLL